MMQGILSMQSMGDAEILYHLKGEALWILNNLTYVHDDKILIFFQQDLNQDFSTVDINELQTIFKYGTSSLMATIDILLKEILSE